MNVENRNLLKQQKNIKSKLTGIQLDIVNAKNRIKHDTAKYNDLYKQYYKVHNHLKVEQEYNHIQKQYQDGLKLVSIAKRHLYK